MPTVEERITAVEAKVDGIAGLRTDMNRQFTEFREDMTRFREDMNRQFAESRADMNRRFDDVDRRFEKVDGRIEILDERVERHFMWMVGIQFSVLIAVIVALIRLSPR